MAQKRKKRADGRYQANVCVGEREDKSKIYETVYAYSNNDLEDKIAEIKNAVNKGIYANDRKMTVGAWAKKWFETDKEVCGIRTKEMYERLVYKHIIPAIGEIRLRDLKKSDVQLMINKRADRVRTCQQLRMATRQMLNFAIEDGLIYKNVALNVSVPIADKKQKRALTETEKEAIKKTNFTDREKAFIYVILCTGLRRGEALALSRGAIDLKGKTLTVQNAVTFKGSEPVLKSMPKTEAGFRTIPITEELEEILIPYIRNLKSIYLFECTSGGLMPKSTYDDFWRRIVDKINIAAGGTIDKKVNTNKDKSDLNGKPLKAEYKIEKGKYLIHGLTAHVFRHNYATMLYYANVKMKDAQYLLGHSNIKITLDIYTHLDDKKSSVAEQISKISAL